MRAATICLLWIAWAGAQPAPAPAPDDAARVAGQQFRRALARPHEQALAQVLASATVVRDEWVDGPPVYDLVVRYDPMRYQAPHAGAYPLGFEEQFVLWGKRVAVFTRSTSLRVGRFYLHDLSTGRQAWIGADEARLLYRPGGAKLPPAVPAALSRWLNLIDAIDPHTDLHRQSRWLQSLHAESREEVMERRQREATAPPPILPRRAP